MSMTNVMVIYVTTFRIPASLLSLPRRGDWACLMDANTAVTWFTRASTLALAMITVVAFWAIDAPRKSTPA